MVRVSQVSQMSEEPEPNPAYRTRSGRVVRQVPRYEPDENTIFDDEESSGSDFHPVDQDEETLTDNSCSDTEDTSETASLTGSDCSDSSLSDVMSLSSSLLPDDLGDEDLEDVLDWDRLTDDAHTGDESSEEEELYDDDEEDTETL